MLIQFAQQNNYRNWVAVAKSLGVSNYLIDLCTIDVRYKRKFPLKLFAIEISNILM